MASGSPVLHIVEARQLPSQPRMAQRGETGHPIFKVFVWALLSARSDVFSFLQKFPDGLAKRRWIHSGLPFSFY
jgi:hypothetical protein